MALDVISDHGAAVCTVCRLRIETDGLVAASSCSRMAVNPHGHVPHGLVSPFYILILLVLYVACYVCWCAGTE